MMTGKGRNRRKLIEVWQDMTVFLFLKQIVDVLYPYRWLDYLMVFLVIFLLIYQILLVRPSVRENFTLSDGIMLFLSGFLTLSFLRNVDGYGIYFKVLSAFLMYFVGRVYYDRIQECFGALTVSSYVIIYVNFFYRLFTTGFKFGIENAGGDLYYYDTDMAFAMILGMIFIGMFGKNKLFKFITVLFVCPYMVLNSDAGIQKALLFVVYVLMVIYIIEKITDKQRVANGMLIVAIAALLTAVGILLLPVFTGVDMTGMLTVLDGGIFDKGNMLDRYSGWREIWQYIESGGFINRVFGLDLCSESLHNSVLSNMNSLYIKTIYSLGYTGILLLVAFVFSIVYYVIKVKDRKTFYITVILAVMLLATGVTVSSMESTQMSWFPMMFAGMLVSSVQVEKKEMYQEEEGSMEEI